VFNHASKKPITCIKTHFYRNKKGFLPNLFVVLKQITLIFKYFCSLKHLFCIKTINTICFFQKKLQFWFFFFTSARKKVKLTGFFQNKEKENQQEW